MRRFRGFTLSELLLATAIVAILAAILLPVFAKVREIDSESVCLDNENQIGVALQHYVSDYDQRTPEGFSSHGTVSGWACQVYPYVKGYAVFACPDDAKLNGGGPNSVYRASSYALNSDTVDPGGRSIPGAMGGNRTFAVSSYGNPYNSVWLFEVANSTYYDLTAMAPSPVSMGFSTPGGANYDNEYGGGSPSGNGIGGTYDPAGMNSEGKGTNTDGFTKYATG